MDYKKILKSRKLRLKLLEILAFIPDELMIRLQYRIKTGRKLNLKNPRRYTEKLQWYKLHYKNPLMIKCVDKYDVREYVESLGLGHILNECYGVFDSPEEVDFSQLPDKFVLKDTLGSGGNSVIICQDKTRADLDSYRKQMQEWIDTKLVKSGGREWPYYSGKKHRILAEKFIECDNESGGLIDYKLFVFGGKVKYLYIIADRKIGESAKLGIFDSECCKINAYRADEEQLLRSMPKPKNYGYMKQVALKISQKFLHSRIDLYDVDGNIIFGEITFFDGSGYMAYTPDSFDYEIGNSFILQKRK